MSRRVSNQPQEEAGISEGDENVYDSKEEVLLYFHIPSWFFFVNPQLHILSHNLINTSKLAAADDLDMNNMLHCLQPTMKRCMSKKAFSLYLPRNETGTGRQEETRLLLRCTEERVADSLVKLII